ncbi:glutathione S-transferase [Mycolicibacterium cyprinidarum]|uniref:Glutathione S-transferase n=1 Tax=Mycolicibacterium cyprinidarum TaxID=2860311 RepID=A0ABQ4VBS6_9MYCO|nr:glutathione S-transferase [Mycolicibacterium sp. NGTWS0302]GJF17293.1 glutathione S-transferase [Mycolicibacterium sp. NGTWSNA01]GJF18358.1 glutathione S-transferase [Mycolicibacterium sp. NGTWS1803]
MSSTPILGIPVLVHLCTAVQWQAARDSEEYRPDSLREVGFVHLSDREQVHLPANRLYAGRTDLMLLQLDSARLNSPVRWERGVPTDPDGMLFPHLYGPLPVAAVIDAAAYLPDRHGVFAPRLG